MPRCHLVTPLGYSSMICFPKGAFHFLRTQPQHVLQTSVSGKHIPCWKVGSRKVGRVEGPGKGELWGWTAVGRVAGRETPCSSCRWAAWMGLCRCQPASILSIFCWTQFSVFASSSEACWLFTEMVRCSEMQKCRNRAKKRRTKV